MLLLTTIPFSQSLSMGSFSLVKCHNVSRFTVWTVGAAEHFTRWGGIWYIFAFLMALVSGWVAFQWVFVGLQNQTVLFLMTPFDTTSSWVFIFSGNRPILSNCQIASLPNLIWPISPYLYSVIPAKYCGHTRKWGTAKCYVHTLWLHTKIP